MIAPAVVSPALPPPLYYEPRRCAVRGCGILIFDDQAEADKAAAYFRAITSETETRKGSYRRIEFMPWINLAVGDKCVTCAIGRDVRPEEIPVLVEYFGGNKKVKVKRVMTSSNGNGGNADDSPILCVEHDVPAPAGNSRKGFSKYNDLEDAVLNQPLGPWSRYQFANKKAAGNARAHLTKNLKSYAKTGRKVSAAVRDESGVAWLYVQVVEYVEAAAL